MRQVWTSFRQFSPLFLYRCAPVLCLDWRGLSPWPNVGFFKFLPIITHNTLQLPFCKQSMSKTQRASQTKNHVHHLSGRFVSLCLRSRFVCRSKSCVFSLQCRGESMFHQTLLTKKPVRIATRKIRASHWTTTIRKRDANLTNISKAIFQTKLKTLTQGISQ